MHTLIIWSKLKGKLHIVAAEHPNELKRLTVSTHRSRAHVAAQKTMHALASRSQCRTGSLWRNMLLQSLLYSHIVNLYQSKGYITWGSIGVSPIFSGDSRQDNQPGNWSHIGPVLDLDIHWAGRLKWNWIFWEARSSWRSADIAEKASLSSLSPPLKSVPWSK